MTTPASATTEVAGEVVAAVVVLAVTTVVATTALAVTIVVATTALAVAPSASIAAVPMTSTMPKLIVASDGRAPCPAEAAGVVFLGTPAATSFVILSSKMELPPEGTMSA